MAQLTDTSELSVSERIGEHANNPSTPAPAEYVLTGLGKQWPVGPLEQRIKAQFEQWLMKNSMQAVLNCESLAKKADSTKEQATWLIEADQQRKVFMNGMASGAYSWRGSAYRAAVSDIPGTIYLLYLLMSRSTPAITHEQVQAIFKENPEEAGKAVRWALGNELAPSEGA